MNKKFAGISGEIETQKYLKKEGYEILGKNIKIAGVEIDVLARYKNVIALIEVKTRENENFGRGIEAVDKKRQKRYVRAGNLLSAMPVYAGYDIRFDVVEVMRDRVIHIEDAFRP